MRVLLKRMLKPGPENRLTALEALKSEFLATKPFTETVSYTDKIKCSLETGEDNSVYYPAEEINDISKKPSLSLAKNKDISILLSGKLLFNSDNSTSGDRKQYISNPSNASNNPDNTLKDRTNNVIAMNPCKSKKSFFYQSNHLRSIS